MLLQPPGSCRTFTRSGSSYPPLGLCQLAATVPRDQAVVLDADGMDLTERETWNAIQKLGPRYLGLTATSFTLEIIEAWSKRAHESGIGVIVGGPHATLEPNQLLATYPSVSAVFRGEGEVSFPRLVERISNEALIDDIPGVVTRRNGGKATIQRIEDWTNLPFPRFDGMPIARYSCPDARRRPMVTFMTARGCPHRCGFCASPAILGRKLRAWSVEPIVDELERLVDAGIREISFVDDVFTLDRRRTIALCEGIVARHLDLSWFCNARADQITPELAAAMASAGCHQVYLGFESGSQAILDGIHKDTTVAALARGAARLAEAGIHRSVGFVLGLPGETDDTVGESIALARLVKPERLQFTRWTPLAGSPLGRDGWDGAGFHDRADDQLGDWVRKAYAACTGEGWGAASW